MSIPTAHLVNVAICFKKDDVNLCIYMNDREVQKDNRGILELFSHLYH